MFVPLPGFGVFWFDVTGVRGRLRRELVLRLAVREGGEPRYVLEKCFVMKEQRDK